MYRHYLVLLSITAIPLVSFTQTKTVSAPIHLWTGGAPVEPKTGLTEKDNTKATDAKPGNKTVIRLTNVSDPTITIYSPAEKSNTGAAVIVCPGGGYSILAMDIEGTEICEWLNSIGITAVLLKYRVPVKPGIPRYEPPLQDAQRALGWVRYNADKWHIDTARIGIMGFSAGAHLSATLSTNYAPRTYQPVDAADKTNCRPDFVMLIYPAYLTVKAENDRVADELHVSNNTPPTLLIQTEDDPIRVESSLFYYLALKNAHVPAEMHLYATGGHGYGMRSTGSGIAKWPALAENWLHTYGIIR